MSIDAYPLCWPDGWKRTPAHARKRAQFGKTSRQYSGDGQHSWSRKGDLSVSDSTTRILQELERFGVSRQDVVISTNVRLRLDGLPRSGEREPEDPGAAAYWVDVINSKSQTRCMAIDRYDRVADNLAAIAATLDAMRAIERHGGAAILDRAFTGFTALPAPGQTTVKGWREVLGYAPDRNPPLSEVEESYKRLRSWFHPDKNKDPGANIKFQAVQDAWEQAKQELKP